MIQEALGFAADAARTGNVDELRATELIASLSKAKKHAGFFVPSAEMAVSLTLPDDESVLLPSFEGTIHPYTTDGELPDSRSAIAAAYDFELLIAAAREYSWDDRTPVSQEILGPLWPFYKPEERPEEDEPAVESQELCLEIEAPKGATDEEIKKLVKDAIERANALHIAHGGSGLTVEGDEDLHVYSPVLVPEGVS